MIVPSNSCVPAEKLKPMKGRLRVRAWKKTDYGEELIKDDTFENLIVNNGKDSILKGMGGTPLTGFGIAGAIGVGDSATVAAVTDTNLLAATNKLWKTIVSTDKAYTRPTLYLSVNFDYADAIWTWNEIGLCDNQGTNPLTGALLWARQVDGTPLVKTSAIRAIVEWQLSL